MSGPALQCLEGTFYRSDEEAYKDAWNRLNHRYGQPFVVQEEIVKMAENAGQRCRMVNIAHKGGREMEKEGLIRKRLK